MTAGDIQFVHDGGEAGAGVHGDAISDGAMSDGTAERRTVTVTAQNDAPALGNNALIDHGGADGGSHAANGPLRDRCWTTAARRLLQFTVSGGKRAANSKKWPVAGVAITTFTQAQVTAGGIQFVHDGGEAALAYSVTVSDGAASRMGRKPATITFTNQNDTPTLGNIADCRSPKDRRSSPDHDTALSATNVDDVDPARLSSRSRT